MVTTETRLRPRRQKTGRMLARRVSQDPRRRDDLMTESDCLLEVARKLKEARALGEACSDRALVYFIDMTIVQVCDSLGAPQQSQEAAKAHLNPAAPL